MRRHALPVLLATVAYALLASAPATARTHHHRADIEQSPDLWATVNTCDTAAHPDTIGIRGSMPALKHRSRLWMRFRVEFLSRTDNHWHLIRQGADSGWQPVGKKRRLVVESGWYITIPPPKSGGAWRLRGLVRFKWTRHGHRVYKTHRRTTAGHVSSAGSDPPGYSAAVCDIT